MKTFLVVGLGNPEGKYFETWHNLGFKTAERFAGDLTFTKKGNQLITDTHEKGNKVIILKPLTYMNLSGQAVVAVCRKYKIPAEQVIVFVDDIYLDIGTVRLKKSGGAGGHNGLKNIILHLGNDCFPRVRIGVSDRGDPTTDLADWVLGTFSGTEKKKLSERFSDTNDILTLIVNNRLEDAMSRYNGDPK